MKGNIAHGAGYLTRGARMLTHPSLRLFVIIPLLVNIVIFGSLIFIGFSYLTALMDSMMSKLPSWLDFIEWILWPLIGITVSLITGYLFTAVALIIASPFNSLLAEKAEELITGSEVESLEGIRAALLEIPRAIVREILKLLYYVPMALFVFVLSIVFNALLPGIGALVTPALWFLLGAWMMSIQFVDYPMDNHRLSFADVKEAVRARRLSSMGFGGAVALCTGIPIINFPPRWWAPPCSGARN